MFINLSDRRSNADLVRQPPTSIDGQDGQPGQDGYHGRHDHCGRHGHHGHQGST